MLAVLFVAAVLPWAGPCSPASNGTAVSHAHTEPDVGESHRGEHDERADGERATAKAGTDGTAHCVPVEDPDRVAVPAPAGLAAAGPASDVAVGSVDAGEGGRTGGIAWSRRLSPSLVHLWVSRI
jgi:hypothetical protein